MKQDVAVISLDAYAGQFYAQQVQELFGERITVCSYSVRDGSIEHMPRRYDLYMVTTDAFDSLGDLHQYVPIDGEMMEIQVALRGDVVRRLQSLPAGKRALFVNLSDKMCREAVTRLNQLGVNQLVFDLYHPGAPEPDMGQYDFVITPQETRYVPAGAKEIIDIGQRVCDSSTMIEAALRLGLEELLESERFEQYQREVATNTYSFDRVFARGLRLESQFEMLMEILDEGIVGGQRAGGGLCLQPQAGGDHRHPLRRGSAPPRRRGVSLPALCPLPEGEGPPARPGGERRGSQHQRGRGPGAAGGRLHRRLRHGAAVQRCGEPAERAAQPASPQGLPGQVYL